MIIKNINQFQRVEEVIIMEIRLQDLISLNEDIGCNNE